MIPPKLLQRLIDVDPVIRDLSSESIPVLLHLMIPELNFHWFIASVLEDEDTAFGFAYLNDPYGAEFGYSSLSELFSTGRIVIDIEWQAITLREVASIYKNP